jgi:group I intron endonuclease
MPEYTSTHSDRKKRSPQLQQQSGTQALKKSPPQLSGVYQIRCIPTGKIYIGSAVNLRSRFSQHLGSLQRDNHRNKYLQLAWNKYGKEAFEFSVLEFVSRSELLCAEQTWIDKTGCTNRKIGFNIYHIAGSPGDILAQVWEGFVDPNGNEVTITNLEEFCRKHGLNRTAMSRLAKGKSKLKSCKGWTHKNSVRQRDYVKTYDGFIAPDDSPAGLITNLAAFCRENNLDNTHMVAVAHGRICSHRGWTHINGKQNLLKLREYTGFISPNGERVIIHNLSVFCKENKLCVVHMFEIKSGKKKSHKGWTWRENNE